MAARLCVVGFGGEAIHLDKALRENVQKGWLADWTKHVSQIESTILYFKLVSPRQAERLRCNMEDLSLQTVVILYA